MEAKDWVQVITIVIGGLLSICGFIKFICDWYKEKKKWETRAKKYAEQVYFYQNVEATLMNKIINGNPLNQNQANADEILKNVHRNISRKLNIQFTKSRLDYLARDMDYKGVLDKPKQFDFDEVCKK